MNSTLSMKTFDLTLAGFDGRTDATDDLVYWVNAPSLEAVNALARRLNLSLSNAPYLIGEMAFGSGEGVDMVLDESGYIVERKERVTWLNPYTCIGYWRSDPAAPEVHIVFAEDSVKALAAEQAAVAAVHGEISPLDPYINTFVFEGEPKLFSSWAG